eukprot:SAG31_NODE_4165_length_3518_cov_5.005850_3_plen_53_part_00
MDAQWRLCVHVQLQLISNISVVNSVDVDESAKKELKETLLQYDRSLLVRELY